MELKKKKTGARRKIVATVILVVILAMGGGGYWAWLTIDQKNNDGTTDQKTEEKDTKDSDSKSEENSTNQSNGTVVETGKEPAQNDTPQTTSGDLDVSAHAFIDGNTLTVGTILIYPAQAGGACTLTVGGFSASSAINPAHNGPNYSVCDDFNVPTSSFSGNSYTIKVTSNNSNGSTSGNF